MFINKPFKSQEVILFIGLFLLSLLSHSIFAWALGLAFLSFGVLSGYDKQNSTNRILYEGIILYSILCILAVKFLTYDIYEASLYFSDAFVGNFALFTLLIITWSHYRLLLKINVNLEAIVKWLLIIHVSLFLIQLIIYIQFNYFIDFVKPFTGVDSRANFFSQAAIYSNTIRATGAYVEPSTYTGAMTCLLGIYLILTKNKADTLIFAVLLTMYLSMSSSGIIIASLFAFYLVTCNLKNKHTMILIAVLSTLTAIIIYLYFYDIILNFYELQIAKIGRGGGARTGLLDIILKRDNLQFIIGYGPFAHDNYLLTKLPGVGDGTIVSINDSGLFIFMGVQFGLVGFVGFVFLLILIFRKTKSILTTSLFIILSLCKVALFHPLFLLTLAFFINTYNPTEFENET
ncbi:hypothetical protein [Vibrio breoganii]|uniref:hypothetical protein n=1 Tax=Vibrio breoganii TaxID=553239 RepID=UPI000C83800A|nr:hypothetical protein [Vibrio breoganii]PML94607.1 hypothetical protein BCT64_11020 [Vibrio breoganii]PMN72791.1 hypothetical protein BCT28_16825 [Vibrio breoganii]